MGRVPKASFPDAVVSAFTTGMPYGHDTRARRVKHSPGMLYALTQNPNNREYLDQMEAWLAEQGIKKVRPLGMGAERAVFEDNDRVVKVGTGYRAVGTKDYVPPQGVWGVTPWLANTEIGPFSLEVQPRVDLVDSRFGGTVRRKPGGADIRALQKALADQGWNWQDYHIGNIGFKPGHEYHPTVIDGPVYPKSADLDWQDGVAPRFPFVPPKGPEWLAALAAMVTGAAAANTAKGDDTVTAGADESLIAYLRRMQETQPGDNAPSMEEQIGEAVVPVGQATLPYYAQEMAGIAKPLSSYPRDFPEMGEYRDRVSAALEKPVIRDEDGTLISPLQYATNLIGVGPEASPVVKTFLLTHLAGQGEEGATLGGFDVRELAKATLLKLRRQGMGGPEEMFPGQTLAQREARRTSPLQEGRYMTSPGLDANLAATRAFNLLSAFQTDPDVMPPTADVGSGLLPLVGAALSNPLGQESSPAWKQFDNRTIQSIANPARSRVLEAIDADNWAQKGEEAGQYRSSFIGGYLPQSSWTSTVGLQRQGGLDNANLNTYLSETLFPQAFLGSPVVGDKNSPVIRQLIGDFMREVPIVPEGADPEEVEAVRQKLASYTSSQEDQFKRNYPVYQRNWNKAMDSIGATGMKVDKFSYPSPALNTVAMAPTYYFDPMTIGMIAASGGAAIPGILAKKSLIGALKKGALGMGKDFVADQRLEIPFAAGMHVGQEPYRSNPQELLGPYQKVFEDKDGKPVDPNDPDYEFKKAQYETQQRKLLGEAVDFGQRYYGGKQPPKR